MVGNNLWWQGLSYLVIVHVSIIVLIMSYFIFDSPSWSVITCGGRPPPQPQPSSSPALVTLSISLMDAQTGSTKVQIIIIHPIWQPIGVKCGVHSPGCTSMSGTAHHLPPPNGFAPLALKCLCHRLNVLHLTSLPRYLSCAMSLTLLQQTVQLFFFSNTDIAFDLWMICPLYFD